ncbi:MAG: hypothetical protein LC114_05885 [Bryobacterales bacterium]|nr:hypothetical protein [Bryobacterales bacterium]
MSHGATSGSNTFRPYIHVQGETTVPSGVCLYGVTGGKWNLIEVSPPILELPDAEQLAALSALMRSYLERFGGFCPFFGRVAGFRLVRFRDYLQFDASGVFVGRVDEVFRRGQVAVRLG